MDRLETQAEAEKRQRELDLYSSMDRLETLLNQYDDAIKSIFIFQYG